jgi:hypothetical protein
VHATTEEIPAERLVIEREKLQRLPALYSARSARNVTTMPRKAVVGYQHPLAIYDALVTGDAA